MKMVSWEAMGVLGVGGRVWMRGSGQVYVRVCKGVGVA